MLNNNYQNKTTEAIDVRLLNSAMMAEMASDSRKQEIILDPKIDSLLIDMDSLPKQKTV